MRIKGKSSAAVATFVAIAALSPLLFIFGNDYITGSITRILILALLVLSVELAWGQSGMFTLGQAVFFGVGAYTGAVIAKNYEITDVFAILATAGVAGLVVGLIIGSFLFTGRRVSELYVALFTLALTYAAQRLATSWSTVGAANGIPGIPYPTLFGNELNSGPMLFYLALAFFAIFFFLCLWVVNSQFGLVMNAIRDDEERAEFFGYSRQLIQVLVFSGAAALAAIGGGLFAITEGFVSPSLLGIGLSTSVVLWVVLGGKGTFYGPIIALAVLQVLDRRMQDAFPQFWPIVIGVLLLLTIVFLPRGLMSIPQVLKERRSLKGQRNDTRQGVETS